MVSAISTFPSTSELPALLPFLTQRERAKLDRLLATIAESPAALWQPFPGPQTKALQTKADVTGYGGSAGGGKTDLLIGAAITEHHRSIIFRREAVQLMAMIDRGHQLLDGHSTYNGSDKEFKLGDDRSVRFAGVKDPGDEKKFQGQPHDLKAFDELPHFTEAQFRYLCGWNRPLREGQRCRVIATMNPPTAPEEEWVTQFFGPWLDPNHPRPAKAGDLRWYSTIDGTDAEVADGTPFIRFNKALGKNELVRPLSRTFFFASLEDNPVYKDSNYVATLQALPEPLRSKLLYGSFQAGREDNPWQAIPTEWVRMAQARWKARARPSTPLSAIGVDVARGGRDKTVLAPLYDNWFDELKTYPGTETPDGHVVGGLVLMQRNGASAAINVDVLGPGGSVVDFLRDQLGAMQPSQRHLVVGLNSSERNPLARDKSGQLAFANKRAEWYWKFREALDPNGGEEIALPPDPELLADLTAPTWQPRSNGIQLESKEDVIARIQRSPDKGDAVVYAHAQPSGPGQGVFDYYRKLASQPPAGAQHFNQPQTVTGFPTG